MPNIHTYSTRPVSHPERSTCMAFAGPLAGRAGLDAVVVATLAEAYRPNADAYVAARIANEAAATEVEVASDQVRARSAEFDLAFDRWTLSIDQHNTRGYAESALRPELGGQSTSQFLRDPARAKVDRMVTLFVHVEKLPALVGDPSQLEALRAATDALAVAVTRHEASVPARARTVEALEEAEAAFDRS
jgi:hypothetical protein